MTQSVVAFIAVTLLFAAWLITHLALVVRTLPQVRRPVARVGLLFPPTMPVVAWRSGRAPGALAWAVLLVGYVALRLVLG